MTTTKCDIVSGSNQSLGATHTAYTTCTNFTFADATTTQGVATTSDIAIVPSFSAGEVLISFLLFIMIVLQLFTMMIGALSKIRTKRTYLGYGGGDVEIRDDV